MGRSNPDPGMFDDWFRWFFGQVPQNEVNDGTPSDLSGPPNNGVNTVDQG